MKVNHGLRAKHCPVHHSMSESPAGIYGSQQTTSRDNTLASDDTGMAGRRRNIAFGEVFTFTDPVFDVLEVHS